MLKKVIVFLLAAALLTASLTAAQAADNGALITAPAGVLMEASTGKILYEKNAHEKRPCASITKVMTLLLVFEAMDSGRLRLDDTITAGEHAASMGGSDIWLEAGETMSADDMIKATAVASANDAAVALAEHISGSEDVFVAQMNERAGQLGMKDTVFKNCNGLDEEGHVTSAYDVALMSRELCRHPKIFDYTSIWLDNLRGGKTQIVNTNKLLKTYNGITGLKTGTYAVKELKVPEELPAEIKVEGGMEKTAALRCEINAGVVVNKASDDEAHSTVSLPESLQAPVEEGEKVGSVTWKIGDDTLSFDILCEREIPQATFAPVFVRLFDSLIKL